MVGFVLILASLTISGRPAPEQNHLRRQSAPLGSADGGALYSKYCSRCHGETGRALVDFCSPDWQKSHTDARIAATIKNGKDGTSMPAFKSYLAAGDVSELVHRIRSFGKRK